MRKSRYFKAVLIALLSIFVLQAGLMAYAMAVGSGGSGGWQGFTGLNKLLASNALTSKLFASAGGTSGASSAAGSGVADQTGGSTDTAEIAIPADVLQLIRNADPSAYDKNVANYKELLSKLNVHKQYQNEIETMIRKGNKLPDILIAYSFVSDSYGTMEEVKELVGQKSSGKSWTALFTEYQKNNPEFVPQSFNSAYLEQLSETEGITKDDIMIADRVSQKTSKPFKEVMQEQLSGKSWREINAGYGIVNGQAELPHVSVAPDKVKKTAQSSGLSEQNVIKAYVIAYKLDSKIETVIGKMKSGYSKVRIYAECLESRYE